MLKRQSIFIKSQNVMKKKMLYPDNAQIKEKIPSEVTVHLRPVLLAIPNSEYSQGLTVSCLEK